MEWPGQSKSEEQLLPRATRDDGYGSFGPGTGALSPGSFLSSPDLDELNVRDEERDEEHEDRDRLYMSQDHRCSKHRSNAPTRHARTTRLHLADASLQDPNAPTQYASFLGKDRIRTQMGSSSR